MCYSNGAMAHHRAMKPCVRFLACLSLLLTGCNSVGPSSVARSRFDYAEAISASWKKMMLLNLVKMRYADAPVFLDVSSIINQYELRGDVDVGSTLVEGSLNDSLALGAHGTYANRPTITYAPMTGERFTRSLMTPIPVTSILSLVQSGYAVDVVFALCVQNINGIENRLGTPLAGRRMDPRFPELVRCMRRIQLSGGLGVRIKPQGEQQAVVLVFRPPGEAQNPNPELAADLEQVRQFLGLAVGAGEYTVVFGAGAANDREIALLTRSMLLILVDFASWIDVPEADIAEGRVTPTSQEEPGALGSPIRVHSGEECPDDAFAAIEYRGHWFWIDDRDLGSKRALSLLMLFFSLTETGERPSAPIVTIPAN